MPEAETLVTVGARLDRLPISSFHRRLFILIGVGMFFDGFDIYLGGSVLGATLKKGFSTLAQNGLFISATFVGMMIGAFLAGIIGDRYGRSKPRCSKINPCRHREPALHPLKRSTSTLCFDAP
jgi:hypothetical protein